MKQTKNFNIVVPELGDKPDITQVSDAIQSLEDALAGTLEVMNATINGTALTLVSGARTTKRTKYYDGMAIKFVSTSQILQNTLTSVKVDDLEPQEIQIDYLVNQGDSVDIIYNGSRFIGTISAVQRSNDINSASTTTVATSNAVKQLNDNKAEKSIQVVAGSGLTGGGDLTSNKTINIVSADEGIVVNQDNIKLNVINAVDSTNILRPASANSVKIAYDKGVSAQASSDSHASKKDNPHSVTKTQIGLSNVANYGISDAVDSSSSTSYASSKSVKTAYDKAMEAFNYARSLCPYRVGDILTTTLPENPAVTWIGTTWQKIEGRYLKGTSGDSPSKQTGGSMTKTLSVSNMPTHNHSASGSASSAGDHSHTANHNHSGSVGSHTHTANHNHSASQSAHAHTQPAHTHGYQSSYSSGATNILASSAGGGNSKSGSIFSAGGENTGSAQPSVTVNTANVTTSSTAPSVTINTTNFSTSTGGGHTHTISVSTANQGDGAAFDIQPSYYTVHYWIRTA